MDKADTNFSEPGSLRFTLQAHLSLSLGLLGLHLRLMDAGCSRSILLWMLKRARKDKLP